MNKNLREGSAPTNTPDNADFSSDIGKTFRNIINIFCHQQASTHEKNSHAGSPPETEKKTNY